MKAHRYWFKLVSLWLLAVSATAGVPVRAQDYPTRPVKIITDFGTRQRHRRHLADYRRPADPGLEPAGPGGQSAGWRRRHCGPPRIQCRSRWLHPFHPRSVGVRGAAGNGRQSPDRGAARFRADRLPRRSAHVHYGRSVSRRGDAGGTDRARQTAARRARIRYQRTGQAHPPERRAVTTSDWNQAAHGSLFRRHAQVLNDGRIPLVIEAYSGIAGAVQAGTVKPLAVASPQRLPTSPTCRR